MGEDSTITFESLYNYVRNEKVNEAIQKLRPEIHSQIIGYLNTKIKIYKEAKDKNLNSEEIEKIKIQIVSARKLIKEFYERRERKILQLAINKSRIKEVDESSLLKEEIEMLDEITLILDKHRKEVLLNLVNGKLPAGAKPIEKEQEPETEEKDEEVLIEVKFIKPMDRFYGKEAEILGPFNPGDIAKLNKDIANILINKETAILNKL
ncbi:MAG: hypothetical protein AABW92_06170 [Nanoarchaeota archaeon]